MDADIKIGDMGEALPENERSAAGEDTNVQFSGHSLLDVLMPASPPEPKNARIIRLFDLEAAKYDPKPVAAEPAPQQPGADSDAKRDNRTRDAEREARRLSLRAAAGLW